MKTTRPLLRAPKILPALLALAIVGCDGGPLAPSGGRVQLTLTAVDALAAAPGAEGLAATGEWEGERDRHPYFQSANVTFSSVLARNTDGQLIDAEMDLPATVDIVALEEVGRTVTLPDGVLPPATYDQIVVVMTEVEGVLHDGTTITVTPPGGGWTAIVPVCPFVVEENATAVVGLMLPVRSAFVWRDGRFRFVPRFRTRLECDVPSEPEPDADGDDD